MNRYIYRDNKYTRLKLLMADIGDELRKSGGTTPRAVILLEELRANRKYIKQKADLAIASIGKSIYNDPLGFDTLSKLLLQKLEINSDYALINSGLNSKSYRTTNNKTRSLINRAITRTNLYNNTPQRDNYVLIREDDNPFYTKKKNNPEDTYVKKRYKLVEQADINSEKYLSIFKIISKHYIQRISTLLKGNHHESK
jgi:hypothetical protein